MSKYKGTFNGISELGRTIILKVLGLEGGHSNHPSDSGGNTMWGITSKRARAAGWVGAIEDIPYDWALDFYAFEEWLSNNYYELKDYPAVAEEVFDFGVNSGHKRAIITLQQALNLCNRQGRDYPDIVADGILGRRTVAALKALIDRRGERHVLKVLNIGQGRFYWDLATKREKDEDFFNGWIANRVELPTQ
ncbi:putative endolysin [Vibrio phage vB_VspS_VS-ABTNL-3]|nr:putative endolysin [Vibrio phage vB_VspS_VS-ABTNL-3]